MASLHDTHLSSTATYRAVYTWNLTMGGYEFQRSNIFMQGNNEKLILEAAQTVGLGIFFFIFFEKLQMSKTVSVFFSDGERTAAASATCLLLLIYRHRHAAKGSLLQ